MTRRSRFCASTSAAAGSSRFPRSARSAWFVLQRLALEFDVGVALPGARGQRRSLKRFHPDVAALRRYLVDEGFMSRERGEYWRTGGRVDV